MQVSLFQDTAAATKTLGLRWPPVIYGVGELIKKLVYLRRQADKLDPPMWATEEPQ